MDEVNSGSASKYCPDELVGSAGARRAVGSFRWMSLAPPHKLSERSYAVGHLRPNCQIESGNADTRHRREITDRVVAERLVNVRIENQCRRGRHNHDGSVRRAMFDGVERNAA